MRKSTKARQGHDHNHCIEDAVAAAERLCTAKGLRFTLLRRRVLELVWSGHKPVGAYALLDQLRDEGLGSAPPTIYRALDFLLEQKFIHRVVSLNAYIACIDLDHPHQGQFVICTKCGSTAEIHAEGITSGLNREGRALGFKVEHQVIELSGLCTRCQA